MQKMEKPRKPLLFYYLMVLVVVSTPCSFPG